MSPRLRCNLAIAIQLALAIALVAAIFLSRQMAWQREEALAWERETRDMLAGMARLRMAALSALAAERGYLLTLEPALLKPLDQALATIGEETRRLERAVVEDVRQAERLARLQGRLDHNAGVLLHIVATAREGRREAARGLVAAGEDNRSLDMVLREIDTFAAVERGRLAQRQATRDAKSSIVERLELLLALAGIFLLGTGVWSAFALRQAVEREEAVRFELERHATTDELTGLANRRAALSLLTRFMAEARRQGRPLSLALLDIDHFKRVNDTFGHLAGDEVLRTVGKLAGTLMREQDIVGRFGGEEFVVVLPGTDARDAELACNRLREAVAATQLTLEDGTCVSVTLSAGIAQLVPGDEPSRLIARADEALYEAKTSGRDRVLLAA